MTLFFKASSVDLMISFSDAKRISPEEDNTLVFLKSIMV